MRTVILLAAACACSAAEVRLVDGRVIEGEVLRNDAEAVVVRSVSGAMRVEQRFHPDQVASISDRVGPAELARRELEAARAALGAGGTAAEWWALAERARTAGESILARRAAQACLQRDRHHQAAARLLGYVRAHGIWMRPDEAAVADGRVWFEGRWVAWAERERVAAGRQEALAAARRAAEAEAELRAAARRAAAEAANYRWPVVQDWSEDPLRTQRWEPAGTWRGAVFADGVLVSPGLRSVYWPAHPVLVGVPVAVPVPVRDPGLRVQASGRSRNVAWAVQWNW